MSRNRKTNNRRMEKRVRKAIALLGHHKAFFDRFVENKKVGFDQTITFSWFQAMQITAQLKRAIRELN